MQPEDRGIRSNGSNTHRSMKIETICKRTKHLTMGEMPVKGRGILLSMTGNPNFPDAGPLLAELDALCTAMEQANVDCLNRDRHSTIRRKACRRQLEAMFDRLLAYVKCTSRGDVQKALSSGFELRKAPLLLPPLPPPAGLTTLFTRTEGAVQLRWAPMHGTRLFHVYVNKQGTQNEDAWERIGVTKKAKFTVRGLKGGQFVWIRVCGLSAQGIGPMSMPLRAMAA